LQLAQIIWGKIRNDIPFRYVSDKPYKYDVQRRIPSVEKAKRLLGFEATTRLEDALDEIIPWIRKQIEIGGI
jgi:nucleoside-diphosphate-sugar epimerase